MLKIGWSKRDVSTTEPVSIPGQFHMRVSKGIMDPIMLSCLVLDDGNDIVIFLSGDFVSGGQTIDDIRSKILKKRTDISIEKIIFHVTHTHCGAGLAKDRRIDILQPIMNIYPPEKYREFMTDMATEAICEAYDNRQEGYIAYGYGYAVVAHSRRTRYSDDLSKRPGGECNRTSSLTIDRYVQMYGPTNHEKFVGFEGGADHFANFMYTFDKNKKLTGAIINIPCPSQNSGQAWYLSADYWHDVREKIYAKYGNIGILPQCAAAGDLAPRTLHCFKAEERRYRLKYDANWEDREVFNRKEIAERISIAFDEVLSWAQKELISDAKIIHTVKEIQLERLLITDDQYRLAKEQIQELEATGYVHSDDLKTETINRTTHMVRIKRFEKIIQRYEEQQISQTAGIELHVIRIGDIAFATNPFELYIDYQHQIQARSPFVQTFIVQLADPPKKYGSLGYLATDRAMENLGYSANIYSNSVSPEGGHTLVEETLKELTDIFKA